MGKQLKIGTIKILTVVGLLLGLLAIFMGFSRNWTSTDPIETSYEILQKWELPPQLREISAIAWLSNDKIAAVQDEVGIIYVYDLKTNRVTEEYKFGDFGDYEGLAVYGEDAFVLRSDGAIFEVKKFKGPRPEVVVYKTAFSSKNNMETLVFDKERNSLLLVPKDRDLKSDNYKRIYAFSLDTYEMAAEPILKIDLKDVALKPYFQKNKFKTFRPSAMAIHPDTGDMYILEATRPKLMVMDPSGKISAIYPFDRHLFPQPEGITFGDDGSLYISTEGEKKSRGVIYKVSLK
ncbi:hypothetical protein KCTC52924_00321 [Arenibacter antarcticus]|uniref:SdiA-regulated domain-containing protein n=1 Tax=Arenibacter antarcticus TaxID=2040469 RepID=A0ABW5VF33_9FLAO|nr:SdiA-regulated domain-containing protein [Arenibacter sp. H213]MCM4169542.1 hypothetical protein [Arenibacter sp. H213]